MSYEALARRWRPQRFDEIIGQDHVVTPLKNAVVKGKIHHAYLFSGTRGIGKTTAARLFARAINCDRGTPPDPCNACDICREVLSGVSTDVLEIDGASNTGIDDVRRLRETAVYVPSKGRYRVYIIDEVHMLSRQAFNGLLKILEEPPSHLVFLLATTEPFRIPETVLSRMIRFDFRLIPEATILSHLKLICEKEDIRYDEPSLSYISYVAYGSLRDSLSILEQCALTTDGALTYDDVLEILGYPEIAGVARLGEAVVDGNVADALSTLRNLYGGGCDLKNLYSSFLAFFRRVALYRFTDDRSILEGETEQVITAVTGVSAKLSRQESLFLFDVILKSERDILLSEFPLPGFEAMLLRAVSFRELLSIADMVEGKTGPAVSKARPGREEGRFPDVSVTASKKAVPSGGTGGGGSSGAETGASAGKPAELGASWEEFLHGVSRRKKYVLKGLLENMQGGFDGEKFVIRCEFQALLDKLQEPDKWHIIENVVGEIFGKPVTVILQKDDQGSIEEGDSPKGRDELENRVLSDPVVIELLREFPGSKIAEIVKLDPGKRRRKEDIPAGPSGGGDEMEGMSGDFITEEEEEEE
ncbi:MAG: DNA polymerase III subunit gamma/tau [Deltaproteobacteria bacterium]|nr:DNA polymerase III subunit gamma/tau [Deltaproteobacteria bacterium]NIS78434.1 DNA polymerase III subunit gamma/tau [Deltaproteobacteria bacterium]